MEHKVYITGKRIMVGGGEAQDIREELDLPVGFGFNIDKSVEELAKDGRGFKRQVTEGADLEKTPRNVYLLEKYGGVNIFNNYFPPVAVETWVGATRLRFNRMIVEENSDRENVFSVEFSDADRHWEELAKDTYLKDLDLGSFTFSTANVEANQENNSAWATGNDLIWMPLIDFGNGGGLLKVDSVVTDPDSPRGGDFIVKEHGFTIGGFVELEVFSDGTPPSPFANGQTYLFGVIDDEILSPAFILTTTPGNGNLYVRSNRWFVKDIRPLFSVVGVLKAGFAAIGYSLQGEILDTYWALTKWEYILSPNYYKAAGNLDFVKLEMTKSSDQTMGGGLNVVTFDTIIQDESGAYLPPGGYENQTSETIEFIFVANLTVQNTGGAGTFTVTLFDNGLALENNQEFTIGASTTTVFTYTDRVMLRPGGQIGLLWVGAGLILKSVSDAVVTASGEGIKGIIKGATIELAEMVHPDYTLFDLLAGFVHTGDMKPQTDLDTKTLTLYPAENTQLGEYFVRGFRRPLSEMKDMTAYIEPDSRVITTKPELSERFVRLQFKEGNDKYIETVLKPTKDNPIYSRTIDLGSQYAPETIPSENPFFEPTGEIRAGGVQVPAMWDNDNRQLSFDIGPRLLDAIGWVRQQFAESEITQGGEPVSSTSNYFFEGVEKTYMPYASQLPGVQVFDGTALYQPTNAVAYGIADYDFYNLFWKSGRFALSILPDVSFLARFTLNDFQKEDFRQLWYILYKGHPYVYILQELHEHDTATEQSTEAVLVPRPI